MRTKHIAFMVLLAVVVLMFTSCDALISNVFKTANLGQPSADTIKDMSTESLVTASGLSTGSVSATFIQTVLSDSATTAAVKTTLKATFDSPSSTSQEVQQAGAILINIVLAENGIDEIMKNLTSSLSDILNQFMSKSVKGGRAIDYISVLDTVFPSGTDVAAVVDTLKEIEPTFAALATNISTNGITIDETVVANIVPYALLSVAANEMASKINTTNYPTQTVGQVVAALLVDFRNAADPTSIKYDDYFTTRPDIATLTADGSTLAILFNAAGLGNLLAELQGLES